MTRTAAILFSTGLLLLTEPALALTCTSTLDPNRNTSYETVAVIASSGAASLLAAISQGSEQWNDCGCVTYLNARPFPFFSTSSFGPGTPVLTVIKNTGFRFAQGASGCGTFQAPLDGSSGTINVYTMGRERPHRQSLPIHRCCLETRRQQIAEAADDRCVLRRTAVVKPKGDPWTGAQLRPCWTNSRRRPLA